MSATIEVFFFKHDRWFGRRRLFERRAEALSAIKLHLRDESMPMVKIAGEMCYTMRQVERLIEEGAND